MTKALSDRIAEIERVLNWEENGNPAIDAALADSLKIIEELEDEVKVWKGMVTPKKWEITRKLNELQGERDGYKHLWETDSAQAKEIIAELLGKLETATKALNYIKSSDNTTISAAKAVEAFKLLG